MPELFFPRVGAVMRSVGITESELTKIERLIILYSCRLISSKDYRVLVRSRFGYNPEAQIHILDFKEQLDFSSIRNNLYRGVVDLIQSGSYTAVSAFAAASNNDIDAYDLDVAYGRLLSKERQALALIQRPGSLPAAEVERTLQHVAPIIKNLVYRKLSFIINNDSSVSPDDLVGLLTVFALRVLREYEVQSLEWEHLVKNMVVSLKNFTANLAEAEGRQKRASARRVKKVSRLVHAWHLDVETGDITEVQVRSGPDARVRTGTSIKIYTTFPGEATDRLVHYKRLYASEAEAQAALKANREGRYSKRTTYLDLSLHGHDEFQQTRASMDAEDMNGLTLLEKLRQEPAYSEIEQVDLSSLGPVLSEFADLVMRPEENEFFMAWTQQNGVKINTCSMKRLGNLACKYLGLTEEQVVEALQTSPASAWSRGTQRRIGMLCSSYYHSR